ncbi:serine protease [Streptomyces ruber]|uniref:Serine protease n=2 Tax=Streptomyces TaxID=1883 RepID=A0A918B9W7_9ACTN|nr:trypsin-like peptidase domain-containing protein [Streptomyces ruber]GGQ42225.1 serine protease [Streptomyces ruber]
MTEGHARGAGDGFDGAHRALRELVMAATVRIHGAGAGYAVDQPVTFLGSGFFIAPNWVLTCAHVPRTGVGGEVTVVHERGPGRGPRAVPGRVAAVLPEHATPDARGNWPAPDLALVQLREAVEHDCVYVSERPAAYYGEGKVLYAGWTVLDGRLQFLDGPLSVQGSLGGWTAGVQLRLGHNDLPRGVSGGPVIDPERGEVVGVLKSSADRGYGGTSTGVEQLRTLAVPRDAVRAEHDDLYQAVFHAHDRYHRDRQRHPDSVRPTWSDVQGQLGARPGRTLRPDERVQLLGRLAELPPPASTRRLLDILESLPDQQAPVPLPAPRGWRDGLGALYESTRGHGALELVLDYATEALFAGLPSATPGTRAAEQALWEWLRQTAERLGPAYRRRLGRRSVEWLRLRQSAGTPGSQVSAGTGGPSAAYRSSAAPGRTADAQAPGEHPAARSGGALRPCALLEVVPRGWEPDRCDWRISVTRPDGEVERLDEAERAPLDELPALLAAPLAEAFRRCDEPGRPAVLQVALPHPLLGLDVDAWRLGPGGVPVGSYRPVVVRCADRAELTGEEAFGLAGGDRAWAWGGAGQDAREQRWTWVHAHAPKAEVLDCDDGLRIPVPSVDGLRGLHPGAVPVLCRYGDQRFEDDTVALARIVHGGFGVALWRRWRGEYDTVCGEFHRRAGDTVAGAGGAEQLPELVRALREGVLEGRAETYWADGIALFYDDPQAPLPGTGDLLEAP